MNNIEKDWVYFPIFQHQKPRKVSHLKAMSRSPGFVLMLHPKTRKKFLFNMNQTGHLSHSNVCSS